MPHASWGGPGVASGGTTQITHPRLSGLPLHVRREVAPLFQRLVDELATNGKYWKDGRPRLASAGGYVKRYVRGSSTVWSNHSWGLAADFNPGENPMQYGLRTSFVVSEVTALASSLGMTWGGNWPGRKDAMHFEVTVSRSEAARIVASLDGTLREGAHGPAVQTLQAHLVEMGYPITVDGDFGPATKAALVQAQRRLGVAPDGIAGPVTLAALDAWQPDLQLDTTDTPHGPILHPGARIHPGGHMDQGDSRLILQGDGNLVLYRGDRAVWATVKRGDLLAFQTDGNLVLYRGSAPVWQSATVGTGADMLSLQSDGNLVLYRSETGTAVWSTATARGHLPAEPKGVRPGMSA